MTFPQRAEALRLADAITHGGVPKPMQSQVLLLASALVYEAAETDELRRELQACKDRLPPSGPGTGDWPGYEC